VTTDPARTFDQLRHELREIEEAQAAAGRVIAAANDASAKLDSAHAWGTYDTWFGGGLISSLVKHDRIDQAQDLMGSVDHSLRQLRKELADIGIDQVRGVEIGDVHKTLDIWFDNIFSDFATQSRISEADERLEAVGHAVRRLQDELVRRRTEVLDEVAAWQARETET
jgi:hypothetical protein